MVWPVKIQWHGQRKYILLTGPEEENSYCWALQFSANTLNYTPALQTWCKAAVRSPVTLPDWLQCVSGAVGPLSKSTDIFISKPLCSNSINTISSKQRENGSRWTFLYCFNYKVTLSTISLDAILPKRQNRYLCLPEFSHSYRTDRSSFGWLWPWPVPVLWPISASPPLCWLSDGKCAPHCSEQYCRRLRCRCAPWPGWWCRGTYGPSLPASYQERRRQKEQPKHGEQEMRGRWEGQKDKKIKKDRHREQWGEEEREKESD